MTDTIANPWTVIAYEVRMFRATYPIVLNKTKFEALPKVIQNAVEESAVLHTRILCDVFLSRGGSQATDDIQLALLFPTLRTNWTYRGLYDAIGRLRRAYGDTYQQGTSCWIINKMMAHPTFHRGESYDYRAILRDLEPLLKAVIDEIEIIRGVAFTWRW